MSDNPGLTAALEYARRGFRVLPLHNPVGTGCSCGHPDCDRQGKHPRTARGVLDATTDEAIIRSWWWSWPEANVGLAMGGGVVALDVDSWAALEAWEAAHGKLPEGPRQTTGKGEHRLFAATGIRNRVRFAAGFDIRSDGGYIVVAPSKHVSGREYEWDPDHTLDEPLPPLPEEIAKLCAERPAAVQPEHQPLDPALVLLGVAEGQRNDTLYRYACRLYGHNKLTPAEVGRLVTAAGKSCRPPIADAELTTLLRSAGKYAPEVTTEQPVPLGPPPAPLFPTDALPYPLGAAAQEIAECVQIPYCAVAAMVLSALSVCTCRRVRVKLPTHTEWTNTYAVIALPPGSRKSSAFELAFGPIYEMEREWQAQVGPEVQLRKDTRKAEEAAIAKLQQRAGRAATEEGRKDLLEQIAAARGGMTAEVPMPRLWAGGDVTQEKLGALLAEQGERLAILDSEGTMFDMIAGRYSHDGKGSSFDLFLKCWRGDPHRVDRIGRDPIQLRAPLLTVCLTTQPQVIARLAEHKEFRGRGLLGRMIFCLPTSLVGTRLYREAAPSNALLEEYRRALRQVFRTTWGDETELVVRNGALGVWREFHDDIERRQAVGGDLDELTDFGSKIAGIVAGIAGNLHMLETRDGNGLEIGEATMARAVAIGHWAVGHARAAAGLMVMDETQQLASRIMEQAGKRGVVSFTGRDVLRWLRTQRRRSVEPALTELVSRGLIVETRLTHGGRPSLKYEVKR